ncbi:biotin/lipoyl-binding protein, partial [Patescibacteria group bacterium]
MAEEKEKKTNKIIRFIKRHLIKIVIAFILIAVLFFVSFLKSSSKKSDFETKKASIKDISQTVSASGEIEAEEQVTLKFQTSGLLSWVGVKKGDKVDKWQVVASLDRKELEKKLKQELLDYMNERWDFEQINIDDYRDAALTETIRRVKDKSQFDLDRIVLDVEIADIALKYANLVTPIAGIVTDIESPYAGVNITAA